MIDFHSGLLCTAISIIKHLKHGFALGSEGWSRVLGLSQLRRRRLSHLLSLGQVIAEVADRHALDESWLRSWRQ